MGGRFAAFDLRDPQRTHADFGCQLFLVPMSLFALGPDECTDLLGGIDDHLETLLYYAIACNLFIYTIALFIEKYAIAYQNRLCRRWVTEWVKR